MKQVKWSSGNVEMIPEDGERYELWDLGTHHIIEKFSVTRKYWLCEWQSELHTNHGVFLTGVSKDRKEVIEQMKRDIEHYKK